jgi:questin oxidase-like protein
MSYAVLDEAYERFFRSGPEWGEDQLTNHGPMAAEVLVRRGYADAVHGWVDAYARRLDDLPAASDQITDQNWRDALGDGRRIGDWTAYFTRQVRERPWREVLVDWWPRLLPGIVAGATHGVIRVSHAVRALLAGDESPAAARELGYGLAFWAARVREIPGAAEPAGSLEVAAALDAIPRIPSQRGTVAVRFGQLESLPAWSGSQAALRAPSDPDHARAQLADLVAAATVRYLTHGHASPVLLVHTATAPNAVLHTLPALPRDLWGPSLAAVWTASAAIISAYAPPEGAPRTALPVVEPGPDAVAEIVDRATSHGDEHVIKFADTAAEAYQHTGDPDTLAAAVRISTLIGRS